MTFSRALRKLRPGEFVRVVCLNRVAEPWLTEVAAALGFDVIWLALDWIDSPERTCIYSNGCGSRPPRAHTATPAASRPGGSQ